MFVAVYTVLAAAATVAFARLTPAILSHQNKTVTSQPQCNTGEVHCCNKLTKASDDEASVLLSELGIVLEDLTADVGIECSPITGIGAGGGSCNTEPVCCENNAQGSLISIGCVPINIG